MTEKIPPPGRELDALVAEKVMGWKDPEDVALVLRDGRVVNKMDGLSWSPSTDISAAWEVVDRLRETSHRDCFALYSPTDESEHWFARFDKKWHGHGEGHPEVYDGTQGETAPHAICLAALKVIEHRRAT